MAQSYSAEEVYEQHLRLLGRELGSIYHALQNELTWLYAEWLEYTKLYGTSPTRVALLNDSAPFLFRLAQDSLWHDVLLGLARLTDPPKSAGKRNMPIKRLPEAVDDSTLTSELQELVRDAERLCEFARQWRHKHLAHRDFDLAVMNAGANPLPAVSRQQVGAALAGLSAVLNKIESHYFSSEVGFEHFATRGDAEDLLHRLAVAARAEERYRERLLRGEGHAEDLENLRDS